jgi:hypothetical protein
MTIAKPHHVSDSTIGLFVASINSLQYFLRQWNKVYIRMVNGQVKSVKLC